MDPQATRLVKEARAIFWPWCAVVVAAIMTALPVPAVHLYAGPLGLCAGILLLAALSWGTEFEQRTLALLLSQGVDRAKIWSEKVLILISAAAPAALLYWYVAPSFDAYNLELWVLAGASVMITICSATFWTLIGRSTIGGLVLNAFQLVVLWVGVGIATGFQPAYSASAGALLAADIVAGCYSFIMLWLGRRKLAAFQATGGLSDGDVLASTPKKLRDAWSGLLRSQPTGAVANMVRREIHFLWPVWLMTLLFILALLCAVPLRFVFTAIDPIWISAGGGVIVLFGAVTPVLAGTLSMGEERTLGTYPWHMILPVSANRQWFLKLSVALISSYLCVNLVFNATRILLGHRSVAELAPFIGQQMTGVWLLCILAFWCACGIRGTVRAIFWVLPVMAVLLATLILSNGVVLELVGNSRADFVNGPNLLATLVNVLVNRFHPYLFSLNSRDPGVVRFFVGASGQLFMLGLFALFVVIQSRRLFRMEVREGVRPMIRNLLPLMAVAFLCGVLPSVPFAFASRARDMQYGAIREVQTAVAKMPFNKDAVLPYQVTLEDLSKVSPISERAQRWLLNPTITIVPRTFTRTPYIRGKAVTTIFTHYTTVQLQHGWKCTFYGAQEFIPCSLPDDSVQYDKTLDRIAIDQQKKN